MQTSRTNVDVEDASHTEGRRDSGHRGSLLLLGLAVVRQTVLQLRLRLRCETHLGRHKKAPQRIKEAARPGALGAQGWPQAADMIHFWRDTAPCKMSVSGVPLRINQEAGRAEERQCSHVGLTRPAASVARRTWRDEEKEGGRGWSLDGAALLASGIGRDAKEIESE